MAKLNSKALLVAHSDKEYVQELRRQQRDMLTIAEHMFGPRDLSYTIVGIEFVDDGPYIWYPLVPGKKDNTNIIIRLSSPAALNMAQAYFQMAHETVHLLSPSGGQNATNLEEGVACFFSVYYMETILRQPALRYNMKSYQRVLDVVTPRLKEDMRCIGRLRERQPSLKDISKEEIRKEFPECTDEDVCFLASKFIRD